MTGTSLREFIHKWHFKTLMLVKLLLLQRRVSAHRSPPFLLTLTDGFFDLDLEQIMFFGYPVERLCTYQYSLVSLIPCKCDR